MPKDKKVDSQDITIKIIIEDEPENPYKNLGALGDCMWGWEQYYEARKQRKKRK